MSGGGEGELKVPCWAGRADCKGGKWRSGALDGGKRRKRLTGANTPGDWPAFWFRDVVLRALFSCGQMHEERGVEGEE